MAAIAVTQVSLYPDRHSEIYVGAVGRPRGVIQRKLRITAVTAADTATAVVLGFSTVYSAHSGYNSTVAGVVPVGVDPVNNGILIGAGPAAATIYLTVVGTPKAASST
jgi:hypothetical protein